MSRLPQFGELKSGDYEKLTAALEKGTIQYPAYVYDESSQRLIHINEDKTFTPIKGEPTPYFTLTGEQSSPINVSELPNNMYIIDGYYTVDGVEGVLHSEAPILFLVGSVGDAKKISCFSSSKMTSYTVTEQETIVETPVTNDNMEQAMESNMEPVPDKDIDDLIDSLFPDYPQGGV
jgi:hypothetical protein